MEVIQFIQNDIKRSTVSPRLKTLLCGVVFFLPVLLGIFLRDRIDGVFALRTFLPNLVAVFALSFSASILVRRTHSTATFKWGMLALVLALFLATERMIFPPEIRTTYASSESFWIESFRCFSKGGVTTVLAGLWLVFFSFTVSAFPSRRWRAFISVAAGVSGAIMLGFHCDSSSVEHVLVGHVGQGLVLGALLFLVQEILFSLALRRAFPALAGRIKKIHKLG